MAPLIQALPKSMPITLIPIGRLGLLPLHAAWTEDNNAPTGKRYALDELIIHYAPNASSLAQEGAGGTGYPEMTVEDEKKFREQLINVIRRNLPTSSSESQSNNGDSN